MTAEIAVMNKEAIALAADSAVTFTGEMERKIFTSASKIFTLSKYQPIGIMVYGTASFMGVPWETIIKIYRNNLGRETCKTVSDYTQNFLSFVANEKRLFSNEEQDWYVKSSIYSYFGFIKDEITKSVQDVINEKRKIDDTTTNKLTSQIIKEHFDKWKKAELSFFVPENFMEILTQKYGNLINDAQEEVFENLPLTQSSVNQLSEIAVNLFTKFPTGLSIPNTSGIVIAGFGTEDIFSRPRVFLS